MRVTCAQQILDIRPACPKCARFIAWAAITETDRIDPGAYYGISTDTRIQCTKCGEVEAEPVYTPTRFGPNQLED